MGLFDPPLPDLEDRYILFAIFPHHIMRSDLHGFIPTSHTSGARPPGSYPAAPTHRWLPQWTIYFQSGNTARAQSTTQTQLPGASRYRQEYRRRATAVLVSGLPAPR